MENFNIYDLTINVSVVSNNELYMQSLAIFAAMHQQRDLPLCYNKPTDFLMLLTEVMFYLQHYNYTQ